MVFAEERFDRRADRRGLLVFLGLVSLLLGCVGLGMSMDVDRDRGAAAGKAARAVPSGFSFSVREASALPLEFEKAHYLVAGGSPLGREDIDLSQPAHWFRVKLYPDEKYWIDLEGDDAAVTGVWNAHGEQVLNAAALQAGIAAVGARLTADAEGGIRIERRDVLRVEFTPSERGYYYIELTPAPAGAGESPESGARR